VVRHLSGLRVKIVVSSQSNYLIFMLKIFVFSFLIFQNYSFAQVMEKSHIIGEPLQYSKKGKFEGCGVNFRFLEDAKNSQLNYATFSVNFYTDNLNAALLKTTYSKVSFTSSPPLTQKRKVDTSWIRLNSNEPIPTIKTMKGEEDSILSLTDSSKALAFLSEILEGSPKIQLGIKEQSKPIEIIMYGAALIKDEDKTLIANCFKELVEKSNIK
jgi:hypothetical protein